MSQRLASILVGAVLLGGAWYAGPRFMGVADSTEDDRGVLATLISKALSSPGMRVSIGAVDGALSSDAVIRDVVIADANGPWLRLDRARLIWTRSALLMGRLSIDKLEIGKLELARKPSPSEEPVVKGDGWSLPDLPVKVEISAFNLSDLSLGQDYLGVTAHLSAEGHAKLGNPSEGLDLVFDMHRTDAVGAFGARLSYVPKTAALKVDLRIHEDQGGLISSLASLPDRPPVDLVLTGDGKLDAFASTLVFDAGPTVGANGVVNLKRIGSERVLTLDAAARIEGLLPQAIGPVFNGATRLGGAVRMSDDGSIGADAISLVAKSGRIDINGRLGADKSLNGKLDLRSLDEAGGVHTPVMDIKTLNFEASATGSAQAPRVAMKFLLDGARLPVGDFGHVEGTLSATPNGPVTDMTTRVDLVLDARGDGLAFTHKGLDTAFGERFAFTLRGQSSPIGDADLSLARITSPAGELSYAGKASPTALAGRLFAAAPDLSRFAGLAGVKLQGSFKGTADLSGSPADGRVDALIAAKGERFSTGVAALDPLIGGTLDVAGSMGTRSRGGFAFSNLAVAGRHISGRIDGEATHSIADLNLTLVVPNAAGAFPDLAGRAAVTARLTGGLSRPDLSALLEVTNARAMGRVIPGLRLNVTARNIFDALAARATLEATIGAREAHGAITLERAAETWKIATEDLVVGDARARVDLSINGDRRANGHIEIKAPNLDDLSPLTLKRLAGQLDAAMDFNVVDARQNVSLVARGAGVRMPAIAINRFDIDMNVVDVYGVPRIDGTAAVDKAEIAGETISRLRAGAKQSNSGSDLTLNADARGFAVDARGSLAGATKRLLLSGFSARRGVAKIALAGPATFEMVDNGVAIRGLALNANGGKLIIDGLAGERLDLTVLAKSLPLSLAALIVPNAGLDGLFEANAKIIGSINAPSGEWRARVSRLMAPPLRSAGLPPIDIDASGALADGRTTLQSSVNLGKAGRVTVSGNVPVDGSPRLDLAVAGVLDASVANSSLAASGRRLTGKAALNLKARGSIGKPSLTGSAMLSGGGFSDPVSGVKLANVEAVARADGENVTIDRATATTRNGGTVAMSGSVRVSPDQGFPAALHIVSRQAELVSNQMATVVADMALDLTGPLSRRPRLSGTVTLDQMDVAVPERLAFSGKPLANAVHVNSTPAVLERLALEKAKNSRIARGPAFDADINLTLSAPARIFVRGRGIDAELGGDLKLTGTLANPKAIGAFEMRRGRLDVAGQRLDFTKGQVDFVGDLTPNLDFIASVATGDVTAQVEVSGPASKPVFAFTSTPFLPQDEVISRLLFSRASGSLSGIQALQLAQTVAELSGEGGPGVFEKMRKSLGVDSLDVGVGADGRASVGASRYISKNVNVGVRTGARPEDSAVTIGVDVTKHIRVRGDMGADGKTSVGAGFELEY
jgi:translocation and assembly module TamB